MIPKGVRYGWYGGIIGGYLFLPTGSLIFLFTQHYGYGVICMAVYIGIIMYALLVAPWKYPDTSYGKLLIPVIAPLVIISLSIAVVRFEYGGQTIRLWQLIFLIPVFLVPVVTTWKTTYQMVTGDDNIGSSD